MAVTKENIYIEFKGKQIYQKDLVSQAKEIWKSAGNKAKDLSSIDLYYKPEEGKCYYVFNGVPSDEFFNI